MIAALVSRSVASRQRGFQIGIAGQRLDRQRQFLPRLESSGQRANSGDTSALQLQRHTGARGFVRSTAVQDHLVIFRNLVRSRTQILGPQNARAGDL